MVTLALHARCFVMRQEEEGEQVIQGLQGPGHEQGEGRGWGQESWAGRQGAAPSPLHRSSGKGGLRREPALGTEVQPQGTNGGSSRLCPRLQGVARRLNSLQGIIIIKAGTGGLGSGGVIFGSGQET